MKPYPIARHIFCPVINSWIKKVTGLQNIPNKGPFIISPNHCSYIEHFLIGSILVPYLNKKIYILAKKEHYDDIIQRTWHKFWKPYVPQIPIDRSKGENTLKYTANHLKKGKIIVVYPEGTRSLTGKIQKGKTGVARLALWAKVPVVPVGLIGTFEILPKGKYIPKFKRAIINIGKPMYFDKYYKRKITKSLLRKITDDIMKEIAKLSKQKYNF